jgi:hypothetical protein
MAPAGWTSVTEDKLWKGSLKIAGAMITGQYTGDAGPKALSSDLPLPLWSVRQRHSISFERDGPELVIEFPSEEFLIASLPLAPGYTARSQSFLMTGVAMRRDQILVTGSENVSVPAGTFECFRVEVSSEDEPGRKTTYWITKGSRIPVKTSLIQPQGKGGTFEFAFELFSPPAVGGKGEPLTEARWNELPWAVPSAASIAGEYNYSMTAQAVGKDPVAFIRKIAVAGVANGWSVRDAWDTDEPPQVAASYVLDRKTLALRDWNFTSPGGVRMSADVSDKNVKFSVSLGDKPTTRTHPISGPLLVMRVTFGVGDGYRDIGETALASLPLAVGYAARVQAFNVNNLSTMPYAISVSSIETIQVPAGSFECFRVDMISLKDPATKTTVWIPKGERMLVKIISRYRPIDGPDVEIVSELKSYKKAS